MTGLNETINTGLYAQLPKAYKDMLSQIKLLVLKDNDSGAPWFPSGDTSGMDAYAFFLTQCMNDINIFIRTTFSPIAGAPDIWDLPLQLGTTIFAIEARTNEFVEIEQISIQGVPYADPRDFTTRWQTRADELRPLYTSTKKNLRLWHLPRPVLTVSHHGFMGFHQTPLLYQGLP